MRHTFNNEPWVTHSMTMGDLIGRFIVTRQDIARASGISPAYLTRLVKGERTASPVVLQRLAKVLRVKPVIIADAISESARRNKGPLFRET